LLLSLSLVTTAILAGRRFVPPRLPLSCIDIPSFQTAVDQSDYSLHEPHIHLQARPGRETSDRMLQTHAPKADIAPSPCTKHRDRLEFEHRHLQPLNPTSTGNITSSTPLPLSALLSPHPGNTPKRRRSASDSDSEPSPRLQKSPRTVLLEGAASQAIEARTSPNQQQQREQPAKQNFAAPAAPARHAPAQRMRSSIACVRCRRSKVKCVNNGINTTCRSCEASGRDCTYPVPVSGSRKREDSFTGSSSRVEDNGDAEVRGQRASSATMQD